MNSDKLLSLERERPAEARRTERLHAEYVTRAMESNK
jgi:hypothetical protein